MDLRTHFASKFELLIVLLMPKDCHCSQTLGIPKKPILTAVLVVGFKSDYAIQATFARFVESQTMNSFCSYLDEMP